MSCERIALASRGEMALLPHTGAVRLRALDRAVSPLGTRPGEPLGGRRALARRRRPRGSDRCRRGGVDVQPLDAATGATVLKLLGAGVRPRLVLRFCGDRARSVTHRPRDTRPAAAARPGSVRVARHVDHRPTGLAARRVRDPRAVHRALRRPGRARVVVSDAGANRVRGRGRARRPRLLPAQSRVRGRPRPRRRSTSTRSRRSPTTR